MALSVALDCEVPYEGSCNITSLTMTNGSTGGWGCQLTAAPATNFSLLLNDKVEVLPSKPDAIKCGPNPQILFSVLEDPLHVCFSSFNISVIICAASESVVGDFIILMDSSTPAKGTSTNIKVTKGGTPGTQETKGTQPPTLGCSQVTVMVSL